MISIINIKKIFFSEDYKKLLEFHRKDSKCKQCLHWKNDCYLGKPCEAFEEYKKENKN